MPKVSTSKIKSKAQNRRRRISPRARSSHQTSDDPICYVDLLTSDCWEGISCFLDTNSALSLYRTSKSVQSKLKCSATFWKHLCRNENFHDYNALKKNVDEEEDQQRMTWSGETFHDLHIDDDSTFWQRLKSS